MSHGTERNRLVSKGPKPCFINIAINDVLANVLSSTANMEQSSILVHDNFCLFSICEDA
jgi:hypothetical protein